MDKHKHQLEHNSQINIGSKWRPRLEELSARMGNAQYASLARWGLCILEKSVANTDWLSYASRLNGRTVADIIAELWQLWVDGEIVLPGDERDEMGGV